MQVNKNLVSSNRKDDRQKFGNFVVCITKLDINHHEVENVFEGIRRYVVAQALVS